MEYRIVYRRDGTDEALEHHGIKGQKWGVRRFQDEKGHLTYAGKERYSNTKTSEGRLDNLESQRDRAALQGVCEDYIAEHRNMGISELPSRSNTAKKWLKRIAPIATIATLTAASMYLLNRRSKRSLADANTELDILDATKKFQSFAEVPKLKTLLSSDANMKLANSINTVTNAPYTNNCGLCTTAMALREMGYDVQARQKMRGVPSVGFFEKAFNSPTKVKTGVNSSIDLLRLCEDEGENAFGNCSISWRVGGGHSIFWKNEKSTFKGYSSVHTVFYDAQGGFKLDWTALSKAIRGTVLINRLDNCEPTEYALRAITSRK